MPKVRMSPHWLAGLSADDDAEWIDTEQRGLVLRVRRGQMVWFVRYLFEAQARRYRIGEHPEIGLSVRGSWPPSSAGGLPQSGRAAR